MSAGAALSRDTGILNARQGCTAATGRESEIEERGCKSARERDKSMDRSSESCTARPRRTLKPDQALTARHILPAIAAACAQTPQSITARDWPDDLRYGLLRCLRMAARAVPDCRAAGGAGESESRSAPAGAVRWRAQLGDLGDSVRVRLGAAGLGVAAACRHRHRATRPSTGKGPTAGPGGRGGGSPSAKPPTRIPRTGGPGGGPAPAAFRRRN